MENDVAPLAGAWIETYMNHHYHYYISSRPSRARGLKHAPWQSPPGPLRVAPLAGAWIETPSHARYGSYNQSRPSRARGLKHIIS